MQRGWLVNYRRPRLKKLTLFLPLYKSSTWLRFIIICQIIKFESHSFYLQNQGLSKFYKITAPKKKKKKKRKSVTNGKTNATSKIRARYVNLLPLPSMEKTRHGSRYLYHELGRNALRAYLTTKLAGIRMPRKARYGSASTLAVATQQSSNVTYWVLSLLSLFQSIWQELKTTEDPVGQRPLRIHWMRNILTHAPAFPCP